MYDVGDVTEHGPVQDFYVSGLAGIEDVGGGNLRFTFYVVKKSRMYHDRRMEKVLCQIAVVMHGEAAEIGAQATLLAKAGLQGVIHGIRVDQADGNGGVH